MSTSGKTSALKSISFPSIFILPGNRSSTLKSPREQKSCKLDTKSEEAIRSREIYSSRRIRSQISKWRQALDADIPEIEQLIEYADIEAKKLFRKPMIDHLIEKSTFPIVQLDGFDRIISFAALTAYPNVPTVPPMCWREWISSLYKFENFSPRNLLFIHFMVWDQHQSDYFLRLLLETTFMEFSCLKNIVIIAPPCMPVPEVYLDYFYQVLPVDVQTFQCGSDSFQRLLICPRSSILEQMTFRKAVAEDSDILMPIVGRHEAKLKEIYGEFCMAELIDFPGTPDRQVLICEMVGYPVGCMSINRAVDLEYLGNEFELGAFNGLKKADQRDVIRGASRESFEDVIYLPEHIDEASKLVSSDTMFNVFKWKLSEMSFDSSYRGLKKQEDSSSIDSDETDDFPLSNFSSSLFDLTKYVSEHQSRRNSVSQYCQCFCHDPTPGIGGDIKIMCKVPSLMSLMTAPRFIVPVFYGQSNTFIIELFAFEDQVDERLACDFLEAAFEALPDLDYCVLTIPTFHTPFPLLNNFVRASPKPMRTCKHELYICHRSSIVSRSMSVRKLCKYDLEEVKILLEGLDKQGTVFADVSEFCYFQESGTESFALLCGTTIVGVATTCQENGIHELPLMYETEDNIFSQLHKLEEQSLIKHFLLSPLYHNHARHFLRDVMLLAEVTSLYYVYHEPHEYPSGAMNVIGELVPVRPRRMIKYDRTSLGVNCPEPVSFENEPPFALYHINTRICSYTKYNTNMLVVVVGASRTAFAFFESIIYGTSKSYLSYNNLIWVSPHGMGTEVPAHEARDLMFPTRDRYDTKYKIMISLRTYVNFIYGLMTGINRTEKYIVVNYDAIVRYDYLIITCGRQFSVPVPSAKVVPKPNYNKYARSALSKFLIRNNPNPKKPKPDKKSEKTERLTTPINLFLVNSTIDANNVLIGVQYLFNKYKDGNTDRKIIIYGYGLEVYLTIQSLLKFGIPGEFIELVEPFPTDDKSVTIFNDPDIDEAVLSSITKHNIQHHKEYYLYDWIVSKDDRIDSVTFHALTKQITIPCMAIFPFNEKLVSEMTSIACNNASLVMDGQLVINHHFRTNDPFIYAAGSCTKYARRYYAKEQKHEFFNSVEVGKKLYTIVRNRIDPTIEHVKEEDSELVPLMSSPVMLYCQLPGDFYYLHIRKPGKELDYETACNVPSYGEVLITGDCNMSKGQGYFRLHLDRFGFVETITCFSKDKIDYLNLLTLYGKHERLLNNLLVQFDLSRIPDLFQYFREPWAFALYHNKFDFLRRENLRCFVEERDPEKKVKLLDKIIDALKDNNWQPLPEQLKKKFELEYKQSYIREDIEKNVLEFLNFNSSELPMYANMQSLRLLFTNLEDSLMDTSVLYSSKEPSIINLRKPRYRV